MQARGEMASASAAAEANKALFLEKVRKQLRLGDDHDDDDGDDHARDDDHAHDDDDDTRSSWR